MTNDDLASLVAVLDRNGINGVQRRMALYRTITVRTPDLRAVEAKLLDLYKDTRAARLTYEAAKLAGLPMTLTDSSILAIGGVSHVGKSRAVKNFKENVLPFAEVGRGTMPMVHAELSSDATIKTVWSDVLGAMKDPYPNGTRITMENRVAQLARQHETEIIVLDECQHLTAQTRTSPKLADMLKKNVQRGQFSIVLVGQEEHLDQMLRDPQIENRVVDYVRMERISVDSTEDVSRFKKFLAFLDKAMVERTVFEGMSGLAEDGTWERIFAASDGLIGVASKIVGTAIGRSSLEDRVLPASALVHALARRDGVTALRRRN
jgi:hypothetical protein